MSRHAAGLLGAARGLLRDLAGLLLPPVCPACRAAEISAEGLCDDCNTRLLALVSLRYCPRCGSTIGPNIPLYEGGCPGCPTPVGRWDRVVRLGPYAQPLRAVIRQLKYHRRQVIPRRVASMLAQAVATHCPHAKFDLVVPIAAHWRRRLLRGEDHAAVLAEWVARELAPAAGRELIRVRNTAPQVFLPRRRRIENVRGAFRAVSPSAVAGTHVLLVDDVTTTGATANEATRTLLRAGASRVTLAVVAKAEPPTAYSEALAG
jgi:ComF family protein